MKSKGVTSVLALLFGGLGVHRFYLNEPWIGLFYLLFCWTFIPVFLGIIDFFCFIFMSEETFNSKYNNTATIKTVRYTERDMNLGRNTYTSETSSITEEIEKLHNLKERGFITEQEFIEAKAKLLK